jgi:RNA polymerase sigma-70 factor (ECF subfamily)
MKAIPGTLQEGGAAFQTTHWTLILEAGKAEPSESHEQALAQFCESYWPPLYAFLRHRRYASADAQDLVQAFFVHLFEKNILEHADRERGRLRTFLLSSLQNFLINEHERATTFKRGGNFRIFSLDNSLPEIEAAMPATARLDDMSYYDLTWAANVVTRAWQNLTDTLNAEGKIHWLEELKPFVAGGADALPNQEEAAERMGVPVATLRTWISRLRGRYRDALRAEVATTVSDPEDVEEEMKYLHRLLIS